MRRTEMRQALERLRDVLKTTNATEIMRNLMRPPGEAISPAAVDLAWQLATASASLSDAEWSVIKVLGLQPLFDRSWWANVINSTDKRDYRNELWPLAQRAEFAEREMPRLLDLLANEADRIDTRELRSKETDTALIRLILTENVGEYSSPERLIAAIDAIAKLYRVTARLAAVNENTIQVVACDSGSDKEVDFLGITAAIQGVKDIVVEIWDRVVFFRERRLDTGLDVLAKSLSMIARIEEMKNKGLGPEECELLKRELIAGARQFIESGATIPEIDEHSSHSPRRLMRPVPKLLAAPPREAATEPAPQPSRSPPPSPFSSEEVDKLRELLGNLPPNAGDVDESRS